MNEPTPAMIREVMGAMGRRGKGVKKRLKPGEREARQERMRALWASGKMDKVKTA